MKVLKDSYKTSSEFLSEEAHQKWLASFPEHNTNPIIEIDMAGEIYYQNPALKKMFPDLLKKGKNHPWIFGIKDIVDEFLVNESKKIIRQIKIEENYYQQSMHYLKEYNRIRIYGMDVTELKKREEELKKANRALTALSKSNQLLMKVKSEHEYLKDVCNIIFRDCGYKLVWIGYAQNDEAKSIKPVTYAGFDEGYLKTLNITWGEGERGQGPTGTAVRDGKITLCQNMLEDPKFLPWRQEAIKRGYVSSIAFPLTDQEKVFGSITIYSKDVNAFSKEEIRLLSELASYVVYGVASLKERRARLEAEKSLEKSKEYANSQVNNLRILLNTAPALIFISQDKYGKNVTGNNTAYEFLNVLKGSNLSKIGENAKRLTHYKVFKNNKELEAKDMPIPKVSRKGKELLDFEFEYRFDTGTVKSLLGNVKPILNSLGEPAGAVGTFVDITDRKEAEKNLQIHAHKLEKITNELQKVQLAVENASDIIFITDNKGQIIYVNKAAQKMLRYSQNELIGKKLNFWKEDAPSKFFEQMWNSIYVEKKPFIGETQEKRKTGESFTAEVRISPVLDKNNKILSFVGIERDITEAKKLDNAKTEFISLAAHQLRTPITTVSLTAEMLLRGLTGKVDKDTKEYLDDIIGGIKKMSEMIELFLNVSRIEMRTFEINPHKMDIAKVIEENIKYVKPQADKKNIQIEKNVPLNFTDVKIDQRVMDIILGNILSNAVKYTPKNGKINVELGKDNENIIIEISDTGVGIPKKQQDFVFDKLFRGDNVAESTEGVGLGLYVVKSLVDQINGKIWLASEKNKGTSFFVSIPLSGMNRVKK